MSRARLAVEVSWVIIIAGVGFVPSAPAHELPSFPRVEVLAARPDPYRPTAWTYTVRVLDPSGRKPVSGAEVRVSGFERRRGSGVRLGNFWLAPTPLDGVYQGTVEFSQPGVWEVTVTVRGLFVGEAHIEATVGGPVAGVQSPLDRPELSVDRVLVRHLLLEWGHLAGFGLWLGATTVGVFAQRPPLRTVVVLTWLALVVEAGTGLYKMEVGTPFPRPLAFGWTEIPRIFFGREYVYTLVVKHLLVVAALLPTAILTWRAFRTASSGGPPVRTLLVANLVLAVAIAACVAVLNLLHAVVLHFS